MGWERLRSLSWRRQGPAWAGPPRSVALCHGRADPYRRQPSGIEAGVEGIPSAAERIRGRLARIHAGVDRIQSAAERIQGQLARINAAVAVFGVRIRFP